MRTDTESERRPDGSPLYPEASRADEHELHDEHFTPIDADTVDLSEVDVFEPIPASSVDQ